MKDLFRHIEFSLRHVVARRAKSHFSPVKLDSGIHPLACTQPYHPSTARYPHQALAVYRSLGVQVPLKWLKTVSIELIYPFIVYFNIFIMRRCATNKLVKKNVPEYVKKKSLIEICYVTLNKWCACVLRNVRGMCNVQGCLTPTFFEELNSKNELCSD